MNIFIHELKANRKSLLIWSGSLTALSILYILLYSAVLPDIEAFKIVINGMPDIAKKLLSIYADSISSLEGFYSFAFLYIMLCGAIQAMNLSVSIFSKEDRERTADFLLTKPIKRKDILTYKLLAALACLIITNIIFFALTIPTALSISSDFNMKTFLMVSATMFFVQLIFMALGIIVSVVSGRIKSVISVSLSTVFGFFIISMLGSVIGDERVRYISPFQFFNLPYIVKNAAYETRFIIIGAVFIIAAIIASYIIFIKKDVHSV